MYCGHICGLRFFINIAPMFALVLILQELFVVLVSSEDKLVLAFSVFLCQFGVKNCPSAIASSAVCVRVCS